MTPKWKFGFEEKKIFYWFIIEADDFLTECDSVCRIPLGNVPVLQTDRSWVYLRLLYEVCYSLLIPGDKAIFKFSAPWFL